MIRLFNILVVILLSGMSFAQQAKFYAEKPTHKFEDVKEGQQLSHIFEIKNIGDAPLLINEYKVACPCTKIDLPNKPILPNESAKLKMTFDSKGKTYLQDRMILLQTNTKKGEEKLRFKVFVIPEGE